MYSIEIFNINEHRHLVDDYWNSLQEFEKERANRYSTYELKNNYVIRHGILRRYLAEYLNCHPTEVQIKCLPNGKIVLDTEKHQQLIYFTTSHTLDKYVIASHPIAEIGVDIEFIHHTDDLPDLANAFFHKMEIRYLNTIPSSDFSSMFYKIWTAKEAYIKAIGVYMPNMFCVSLCQTNMSTKDNVDYYWTICDTFYQIAIVLSPSSIHTKEYQNNTI
ncbi:MAG: hypothetical protein RIS29_400 [Bacteroidota bacterium]|jgi:4'-phosphopantetheinyl transferase